MKYILLSNKKKTTMAVLILALIFIMLSNCEEPVTTKNKLFDAKKLSSLSLNKVESFWADDSIKNVSDYITASFNSHTEFIKVLDIAVI